MNSRLRHKLAQSSHDILELVADHDFLPSEVEGIIAAQLKEEMIGNSNCGPEYEAVASSRARALAREYINYAFGRRRAKDRL